MNDTPPPPTSEPTLPASANSPSTPEPSPTRRLIALVRFVATRTFVDPVRRGRIAEDPEFPWPRGLALVVAITYAVYAILVVLAFTGTRLREAVTVVLDAQGVSVPWPVVGVLTMALVLIAGLGFVASARMRHPLRYVIAIGMIYAFLPRGPVTVLIAVGILGLWVWLSLRHRRRIGWWEVPVAVTAFSALLIGEILNAATLGQPTFEVITRSTSRLTWLAIPSVLGAGAAITELSVSVASWTARGVWEATAGLRRAIPLALLAALVLWTGISHGRTLAAGGIDVSTTSLLTAAGYVILVALAALGVLLLVPRGLRPGVPVDTDDISAAWPEASRPLVNGFALVVLGAPFVALLLSGVGWQNNAYALLFCLLAVYFGWRAIRVARRGQDTVAVLFAAFAAASLLTQIGLFTNLPIATVAIPIVVDVLALLALAGLLITRSATGDRLLAVATVLLLTRVYGLRGFLDEPFTNLFALSSATGALAVGLVWRQLTEYERTRTGSVAFPIDVRVLLALANTTLIGMAVVLGAVGSANSLLDLGSLENLADTEIGGVLYLAAASAGLLLAWRGREGGDQQPGEEFTIDAGGAIEPKATVPAPPRGGTPR